MKVTDKYYDEVFDFKGQWDVPSRCGLRVITKQGKVVVIATELYQDNPGTSVTAAGRSLAQQICAAKGLSLADITYLECNPDMNSKLSFYQEEYFEVSFKDNQQPAYRLLTAEEVDGLSLKPLISLKTLRTLKPLLLMMALCACTCLSATAQTTIKLWDAGATHKQQRSELTAYLPDSATSTGISVIVCPGGSYSFLAIRHEGHEVAQYLQSRGIAAFVLRYRTGWRGNHHPAMIQDLQRAMMLAKEMCKAHNLDPDKVGVMGFSAGGHLAGTAATYFDTNFMSDLGITPQVSLRPAFVAMIYPVVSMGNDTIAHRKSRRNLLGKQHSRAMEDYMSLERHVRPDMPPVFLLHCTGDKTVDCRNSTYYDAALTQQGVPHKFLLYDETGHGGHGFGIRPNGSTTGWQEALIEWVKRQ
jgi:acetyl esterase/lipase